MNERVRACLWCHCEAVRERGISAIKTPPKGMGGGKLCFALVNIFASERFGKKTQILEIQDFSSKNSVLRWWVEYQNTSSPKGVGQARFVGSTKIALMAQACERKPRPQGTRV